MKKILIINLADEVHEYVGDSPEESWGYCSETAEYGSPDELALNAAAGFFGYLGSDDPEQESEVDEMEGEIGASCSLEPNDRFWFDVHHNLNLYKNSLKQQGLTNLVHASFHAPNLILEVSTEMDMTVYHEKLEPPRS